MTAKELADLWVTKCEKHFSSLPYVLHQKDFPLGVEIDGPHKVVETKTPSGFTNDFQREEAWSTEFIIVHVEGHYEDAVLFCNDVWKEIKKICPEVF